jgi:hypothetical protein
MAAEGPIRAWRSPAARFAKEKRLNAMERSSSGTEALGGETVSSVR